MPTIYKSNEGVQFTVTDERPIGGFSPFGTVYAAAADDGSAWVVKVSKNPDFNARFEAEYHTLTEVAKATQTKYKQTYSPDPVHLVRADESALQAIAMPRYDKTLASIMGEQYKSDAVLEAETWLVYGATCYLKVLDAIHATAATCSDRKQDDFFITSDNRVVTIDWNVLQAYTDEARVTEIKVTVRRWVELASQRNARENDLSTAFTDSDWVRTDAGGKGGLGSISVGLRWIFAQALGKITPDHFETLRKQLDHWRSCLDDKTLPDRQLLGISNEAVFNAVELDLELRLGRGNQTARTEAVAAALAYPANFSTTVINQFEAARRHILGGDSNAARQALDSAQPSTPDERAAVGRWSVGLDVLAGSQQSERTTNRPKILTILNRLTRRWQEDAQIEGADSGGAQTKLEDVLRLLDELDKRTTGVESPLSSLRAEAAARAGYLAALKEKDTQKRHESLTALQASL